MTKINKTKLLLGASIIILNFSLPEIVVEDNSISVSPNYAYARGGDGDGGDGGGGDGGGGDGGGGDGDGGGDGGGDGDGGDGGDGGGIWETPGTTGIWTSASCEGQQIRENFCLDYKGNVIDDVEEHWRCDEEGDRPSTTLAGCTYSCPRFTPGSSGGNRGDGGGDGAEGDPLVFDLDGNGVSLMSVNECTMFDIDNDGSTNMTGWVDPNDGLLVLDDNGNGIVDDQSELFGNRNRAAYEDLAQYDENDDGIINADDSIWGSLQLWVDANSDGQTNEGELKTLGQMGFKEINVNYDTANEIREGNAVTATGSFTRFVEDVTGKIKEVVAEVVETFFDFF